MNSKSILRTLFQTALVLCLIAQTLPAATFGKFTYTDDGASITITNYNVWASGAVAIPATIAGNPVTSIGNNAFEYQSGLTRVTIPNSVTSIGARAFNGCSGLTSISIGTGVTAIGDLAFWECRSLKSISIPNSVTSIGHGTFYECRGLTSITIPNSLTSIGSSAFEDCSGLTAINVDGGNHTYSSVNGVLCNYRKTKLLVFPNGKTGSYSVPNSVTSIGEFAFVLCSGLTSVTIPNSVTSIEYGAFAECSGLTRAVFLGNAPSIDNEFFEYRSDGFTVYYLKGKTGFTSPKWHGYPAVAVGPNPEIDVQQPIGSSLVDGTAKKSFGTAKTGMTGSSKTFIIKNTGAASLTGFTMTKTGANAADFIVIAPTKVSLAVGATTTFKVTFKPTATGTRTAAIHITSNDANENPFDIQLSGLGVAP